MKREIKFRAWDGEQMIMQSKNKEYDDYYMLTLQGDFYAHTRTGDEYFDFYESELNKKTYELMQYTGLKDKNGVEIYEGDILKNEKSTSGNFFVKFNVGGYDAVYKNNFTLCLHPVLHYFDGAEVTGNIYENPELLA